MYLSRLDNNQTFTSIYRSLLAEIIAGNNEDVKNEIDKAIYEAISIILGDKEAYLIDNKHFYFTNFLISHKEILDKEIKDCNITQSTYKDIALLLNA